MNTRKYTHAIILILICSCLGYLLLNKFSNKENISTQITIENTQTSNSNEVNNTSSYPMNEILFFENNTLSFRYTKYWEVNEYSDWENCKYTMKVELKCIIIKNKTNSNTIFIIERSLVNGDGLITQNILDTSKLIKGNNSYLLRQEFLNYSNPEINIPTIQLYFVENDRPSVGDIYTYWQSHDGKAYNVSYRILNSELASIDANTAIDDTSMKEMDRIVETIEFK